MFAFLKALYRDFVRINDFVASHIAPRITAAGFGIFIASQILPSTIKYINDHTTINAAFNEKYVEIAIYIAMAILAMSTYDLVKKLIESLGFTSINSAITEVSATTKGLVIASLDRKGKSSEQIELSLPELLRNTNFRKRQKFYRSGDPLQAIEEARSRLLEHIARLRNNSVVNLAIAIALAVAGIYALASAYSEIESYRDKSNDQFKLYDFLILILAPRITIAVFIQIFSYFFLLMYRITIGDVRYFQNELTNLDCYAAAISMNMRNNLQPSQKSTVQTLLKVERNRFVPKNQKIASGSDDDHNIGKLIDINKHLTGHIRDIEKQRG